MANRLADALEQAKQALYRWYGGGSPEPTSQQAILREQLARAQKSGFKTPTYAGPPVQGQSGASPVYYSPARSQGMTRDNIITNRLVDQGRLPESQREIYPQGQGVQGTQAVNVAAIQKAIEQGLKAYGADPKLIKFAPKFAQAAQRYPVFAKHPFLLPQISILETSGGKNITRPNNPLNWGARVQAAGGYNPASWDQSIEDVITAIGGDPNRGPAGSARRRQATYYQPFRESGDLKTFANIYEPGNANYYSALAKGIPQFEKYYR